METVETPLWKLVLVLIYAATSIGLTVYLARILRKNGAIFLADVFDDKPALAQSLNQLLVTGFYMLNLGYACSIVPTFYTMDPVHETTHLITKIGTLLISLGVIHFANLFLFHKIRRRTKPNVLPLPVMPQVKLETKMAG